MRRFALPMILSLTLLTGCSLSPAASGPKGNSTVTNIDSSLKSRGRAPNTRSEGGSAGALIGGPSNSATSGKPEAYGSRRMTIQLEDGPLRVDAEMLDPAQVPGYPQRYRNDCAQSALAITLDFLGVTFEDKDPYEAIAQGMAPMAWGTRMEDIGSFVNKLGVVKAEPVRQASISYLEGLLAQGKPVPVVLSLSDTTMHYVVVIGTGMSAANQKIILFKDPANADRSAVGALDDETFLSTWENRPIRGSWWSWFGTFVTNTNSANYERLAFDIGIVR